ncbi:MAG: DNA/RNA non-specific endonuclease, partial [Bacteroidales bacterium]|nr:DNA/RNA non-specific endonuclease [Bacteroidales bacterium]
MKTTHIALLGFALLLAACTAVKPDSHIPDNLVTREFTASISPEAMSTRTSLDGMNVLWDESGETISIVASDGSCYTLTQKSVSSDRTSATFSGDVPESGLLYAIYPAQNSVSLNNGNVSFGIPAVQTAVQNSFASATAPAISKVTDTDDLHFKNVCGLIGFTVNASDITSIKFSASETNDGALTGPASVNYSGSAPVSSLNASTGNEFVELTGNIISGKKYWALIAPGDYYDLKVIFTNSEGRTATFSSDNTLEIERSKAQNVTPFTITETDWDDYTEPGGTAMLTYSECAGKISYNSEATISNTYGTWLVKGYDNSAIQLNSGSRESYIRTPVFEAPIKEISLTLSGTNSKTITLYACKSAGTTSSVPTPNVSVSANGANTYTLDASSLNSTSLYIRSQGVALITKVNVVWGGGGGEEPEDPEIPIPDPNGLADFGWFELPAQTDKNADGQDDNISDYYYSHTMRADASRIRNFSSCYSKSKLHPIWVAAPMHSCYKGSSGRNENYRNDPGIPFDQAPKWSGYTRGHMIGSSDRTISVATNKQVFYYSNIGAQLETGFNQGKGAWNLLEGLTDNQWCSDTLYQVVGCIFQTFTTKNGNA